MEQIIFQYYPARVKSNNPIGWVTLDQFIRAQQNPKDSVKDVFRQIEQAELDKNKKLKADLKQNNLYYFTPCVNVGQYRRYTDIVKFTGLLVIDFDHLDNAPDLKQYLFDEYKSVVVSWLSPSKSGVKCLVRIPEVHSVSEFKEYYFGIAAEMEQYAGFDSSGQNAVLPLFQSWDPELLSRDDADLWTIKGVKVNDLDSINPSNAPFIQITNKDKESCVKMIHTGFSNITDCGHPPLRSLCLSIGGYVATGYLSDWEAMQMIEFHIENHGYLKKGIPGYKKTARWALNQGKNKPLILKHD